MEVMAEVVWMQYYSSGVWDECDYSVKRAAAEATLVSVGAGMELHAMNWCLREVGKEIQTLEHS